MDFLINTPSHKRWILPDGLHYYNEVLFGDWFHVTIWDRLRNELVLSLPAIYIDDKGQWKDLLETAQALAERKFARRSKAESYAKSWRR